MGGGILNLLLRKNVCDLRGAEAVHTQSEYLSYHRGGILVHDPAVLVLRVFEVAVWRIGTQRFAGLAFGLEHRTDLLDGVG